MTCLDVLRDFGEDLSEFCDGKDIVKLCSQTTKRLEEMLKREEMHFAVAGNEVEQIQKFYSIMAIVAFFCKPHVSPFICIRVIDLTLQHGLTKFSLMGIIQYLAVLLQSGLVLDVKGACDMGKAALSLMSRFDMTDLAATCAFVHFGFAAHYSDPFQCCEDQLKQAFEIGMVRI